MMWLLPAVFTLYVICALLMERGQDDQLPFDTRENPAMPLHTSVHFSTGGGTFGDGGAVGGGGDGAG